MNFGLRNITDPLVKKTEFVRCFIKWTNLRGQIAELGADLYMKDWIIPHPDHPNIPHEFLERPFYNTIRNTLLSADWARQHDSNRENASMRANTKGFSSFTSWMEAHNRRLRSMQYHKTDESLKVLMIQKLTKEFRDNLCDCQVSESLPYAEWKKRCKEVEECCPPGPISQHSDSKSRSNNNTTSAKRVQILGEP